MTRRSDVRLFCLFALACAPPTSDRPARTDREPPEVPRDTDAPEPEPEDTEGGPLGDTAEAPIDTAVPSSFAPADLCFPGADALGTLCIQAVPRGAWGADWRYPRSSDARYRPPVRFLDLTSLDPALQLAPNFTLSELAQAYKGSWAVVQPHFIARLQALREEVGAPITVNSGYRNPAWNQSVGGASFSRHQWGDAADITAQGMSLEDLGALCTELGAGWVGYYGGHVHCDWRNDPLDGVLFEAPLSLRGAIVVEQARTAHLVAGNTWSAPAVGWDEGEPLRVWRAIDAAGHVLATHRGRTFTPPAGTTRVTVVVGQEITLEAPVP